MNDRDLITLTGLAEELAHYERLATGSIRVHASEAVRPRRWRGIAAGGGLLAAAVALAAGVAMLAGPRPAAMPRSAAIDPAVLAQVAVANPWTPPRPQTIGVGEGPAETGGSITSVVLSIFRDLNGDCSCLTFERIHAAEAECAEQAGPVWLASAAMERQCMSDPHEVMVVSMSGPAETLPLTYADAAMLAECFDDAPDACGGDPACISATAAMCVDPSVRVVAEVLPLGPR